MSSLTHSRTRSGASERGQASVELVTMLPLVLLVGLLIWQLALVGHTAWLTANASRNAARADTVGGSARAAARSALPQSLERDLEVERLGTGGVRVGVRVPILIRAWRSAIRVSATSALGRER